MSLISVPKTGSIRGGKKPSVRFMKIKNFWPSQRILLRAKRQDTGQGRVLANCKTHKGLTSRMF